MTIEPSRSRARRSLLVWTLAITVTAAALAYGASQAWNLRAVAAAVIDILRAGGPWAFFGSMAVLPVAGFPLLPFTVAAGPAFGETLGIWNVAALAVGAVAINVSLSYWLAARALRPWVIRGIRRFGYELPQLPDGTAWHAVLVVRLAPGLPFFVQSYALGVMRVNWWPYLVVSTGVPALYLTGVIIGGDALFSGNLRTGLIAFGVVGLVAAGIQLWRKLQKRTPATNNTNRL